MIASAAIYHLARGVPVQEGRRYPWGEERAAGRPFPVMGALTTEMREFEKALGSEVLVDWGGKARTGPQVDGMGDSLVSEMLFAGLRALAQNGREGNIGGLCRPRVERMTKRE